MDMGCPRSFWLLFIWFCNSDILAHKQRASSSFVFDFLGSRIGRSVIGHGFFAAGEVAVTIEVGESSMEKSIHPMSNMFHGHIPFTADNLNGCPSTVWLMGDG
jgi:hypothetical protein